MNKKMFIRTFGCQMNEYDSDKMADIMHESGVTRTHTIDEADIVILNTCSVREKAQEKVFSDLGRIERIKKEKPDLVIGVGGCVASQEGEQIIRRAPYVDVVFGPQTIHRLPQLIAESTEQKLPQVDVSFPEIEKFDSLPQPQNTAPTAFVSIMEGCSKYCTFCVVPYTRGEEVSRPLPGIVDEIKQLVQLGTKEVTLLGQNVNAYVTQFNGMDIDFTALLECVCDIDGIERVRFTTSHPIEFSDRLINAYSYLPKLPDYLHLPVQSGSDKILAQMKRGYTVLEFKRIIRRVREHRPAIHVSSDFIVGFPGETDADFAKTMQLIDEVGFDFSFSFIYSPRPGTPAAFMVDETPAGVKKERLAKLQTTIDDYGKSLSEKMMGQVVPVLVEGKAKRTDDMKGRAPNNRVVNFSGSTDMIGHVVPVAIQKVTNYSLIGQVADKTAFALN